MASGRCVPHKQAAHMAAPTEGQNIKKTLANGEPSTHDPKLLVIALSRLKPGFNSRWEHQLNQRLIGKFRPTKIG